MDDILAMEIFDAMRDIHSIQTSQGSNYIPIFHPRRHKAISAF